MPKGVTYFSLLQKSPDPLWAPNTLLFIGYQCSYSGVEQTGVKLITHVYLMKRLRMSGAINLRPIYSFMACARTTLHFHLRFIEQHCQ